MKRNLVLAAIIVLIACAPKTKEVNLADLNNELNKKFMHGKKMFDKKKYSRAIDDFDYIILNDVGSELGMKSRYYQAESLFNLEQYSEAITSYNRYLNYSMNQEKIEHCRYRICKSYFEMSNKYNRDQTNNDISLEMFQLFIDDFPQSNFVIDAEKNMLDLRMRKARKLHETGRLYLKEKEFDSALIYFNDVIKNYYDTSYSDEARISIVFAYLVKNDSDEAKKYYNLNQNKFNSLEKKEEVEMLLAKFEAKSSWFSNMVRLYK